MQFTNELGPDNIAAYERNLCEYALEQLKHVPGLRIIGPQSSDNRIAVFSFVIEGRKPQEILESLDARGIAVRAGDLASLPLLQRFRVDRAVRASFYLYNSTADVDRLVDALLADSR
jgi:cysteine desulfurase/selenocysteine lyase